MCILDIVKALKIASRYTFFSIGLLLAGASLATEGPKIATKGDPALGEILYSKGDSTRNIVACASCHGPGGQSISGTWPKLAGQHPGYIYGELVGYKTGERANAVMMGMASALELQDMKNLAAYLAKQPVKAGTAKNKDTIMLGQSIYRGGIAGKSVPACAGCHGPNGAGIPVQYPRIGGQWAEYTEAQLIGFRSGARKNAQMNTIAAKLSDTELKAVADYIAGIR